MFSGASWGLGFPWGLHAWGRNISRRQVFYMGATHPACAEELLAASALGPGPGALSPGAAGLRSLLQPPARSFVFISR